VQPLEVAPFLGSARGEGSGLIARDDLVRGGPLTGLLVGCIAAEQWVDVLCACGTALSKDRLSLSRRPFGLVGRVFDPGHTAGKPTLAAGAGRGVARLTG
jgi:hypothetical protein